MEQFLKQVADHLHAQYGDDLHRVCLVFPGRRASVFFMRLLSEKITDKPVWLPPVRTISELFSDLSKHQVANSLTLLFELYKTFNIYKPSDETFDNFFPFGEMILNDFDDIDKYLIDTNQLFQNLSDYKDIDIQFSLSPEQIKLIQQFWKNITIHEPGPLKRDFIGIWNQLDSIYKLYGENLRKNGIAYEGMVYREVCNEIKSGATPQMPYKHFAIIGFNALNECEKLFFSYLQKSEMASFYWDFDKYYVENTWHEAGFFLRDNLEKFPNSLAASNFVNLTKPKDIQVISVSSDVGQAKLVSELLLTENAIPENLTNTVIVLGDEQLMVPVLSSLPEPIKDVNVSLGYPLKLTPVYSFLEALMTCYKTSRKMGGEIKFYHRDVLALLNHPYLQFVSDRDCTALQNYIVANNRIYLSNNELGKNEYLRTIFVKWNTSKEYIDYLLKVAMLVINGVKSSLPEGNHRDFHLEYWFTLLTEINRLKEIIEPETIEFGIPILFKLVRKIASGLSIPFKGEPLVGLQVMGVLETRAIDFSKVIFLSANEGIFPKSDASASYIPYNLRKGFGLPTIEHQDAIFAYYFYRLIQRADSVSIVYNSQPTSYSGEMSRFIYQLKYENVFTIKEKSVGFSISLSDEKAIIIDKNKEINDYLNIYVTGKGEKLLTPTALSAYMSCSLKFYFKYIAKIQEKEVISEDIESSVFGKLLHYAMEWLYQPYVGQLLNENIFEKISEAGNIDKAIMLAFGNEYFKSGAGNETLHGKSILIKEILKKYICQILFWDKQNIPFTIASVENRYQTTFDLGDNLHVNVGGIIDRLDLINDSVRIIDYKTGNIEFSCTSVNSIFDREGDTSKYSAIFQSMLYALVIKNQEQYATNKIYPGLYGLRKIFNSDFDCAVTVNKQRIDNIELIKAEYEEGLKIIIREIFNPSTSFSKTDDVKKCEKCPYREICHR